jgi:hypothetical protein
VSQRTDRALTGGARCNFDKEIAMKRTARLMSMIAAAVLAAPAAMAGSDIVKCVDASGRVTLTDQPCDSGAVTVRLEPGTAQNAEQATPRRYVLPAVDLRHNAWKRPAVERPAPLSRDVATLKAARRTLLLLDAKPVLAGLN